jgi:hypothetical protein
MMMLRRFNADGVTKFNQYLDLLSSDTTAPVPDSLLEDPFLTAVVAADVDIERRAFSNRLEAAQYLDSILSSIAHENLYTDSGLWAWLTLLFFDQVCPMDSAGTRKARERVRYVPAVDNYQKYYRHLLAGPYRVYRAHRDNPTRALVLLCGPLHQPGEIVEQLVARQEIITNPHAIALATEIYYDTTTGSFRRGAAGKGGGSARRFSDILNQFDLTWDLYWMTPDRIRAKLPREFARFVKP